MLPLIDMGLSKLKQITSTNKSKQNQPISKA